MIPEKCTPGPWAVVHDNGDRREEGQWFEVGPARVWFPYGASDDRLATAIADAAMVAAAQDLYLALEAASKSLRALPCGYGNDPEVQPARFVEPWGEQAMAALKKARGLS